MDDALVNMGCIVKPGVANPKAATEGRTYIVSGLARSGTTMAAQVLREAGLYLGKHLAELVCEDREMLAILHAGRAEMLDRAIAARNAEHRDWGFKIPNIHVFLRHTDLSRFRNPHLVFIFRDPLAVAARNAISEYFDQLTALSDAVVAQNSIVAFVQNTDCPSLLMSYEKALIFPDEFVDTLTGFCGLRPRAKARRRAIDLVRPNPESYLRGARRHFAGSVDALQEGVLHGWCCQLGELEPVALDLFLDGSKTTTFRADRFRADLIAAGFGNGNHGFSIDLGPFRADPAVEVRVTVSGRTFELDNSGRRLGDYMARSVSA
ncbi:MAG: hypothetical protein J0H14_23615 [Alphaproteobacteria bacterium]|nr:hypothetical protein [Alphaproteobacteria bacterium]